jgi:hypothetical protein
LTRSESALPLREVAKAFDSDQKPKLGIGLSDACANGQSKKLIEDKAKGEKRQAPPPKSARSNFIDLVAALQGSLAQKEAGETRRCLTSIKSPNKVIVIEKIGRRLRLGDIGGGPGLVIGEVRRIPSRLDGCYEMVNATNPAAAFNFMGCGNFERTRKFEAAKKNDPNIMPD